MLSRCAMKTERFRIRVERLRLAGRVVLLCSAVASTAAEGRPELRTFADVIELRNKMKGMANSLDG